MIGLRRSSNTIRRRHARGLTGPAIWALALVLAANESYAQIETARNSFDVGAALGFYQLLPRTQVATAIGPDGNVWTRTTTRNATADEDGNGVYRALERIRLDVVRPVGGGPVPVPWQPLIQSTEQPFDYGELAVYEWVTMEAISEASYDLAEAPAPSLAVVTVYASPNSFGERAYISFEQLTPFPQFALFGDVWLRAGHIFSDEARTTAVADEVQVWMMQQAMGDLGYLCRYTFRGSAGVALTLDGILSMTAINETCLLIDRAGAIYSEIVKTRVDAGSDNSHDNMVTWYIPWRAPPQASQPFSSIGVGPPAEFMLAPLGATQTTPAQPAGGFFDDLPPLPGIDETPQRPEAGGVLNLLGDGNNDGGAGN